MINFFLTKEGGLFDFDLTLPLIIFEFIFLLLFLKQFLFNPILSTIEDRRKYINDISGQITSFSSQAEELRSWYSTQVNSLENELSVDTQLFNQKVENVFSLNTQNMLQSTQKTLKNFELALFYSYPIYASSISTKSFQGEENLIKKYLKS